jgi:hypothetical protein
VARLVLFLLSLLTGGRPGQRELGWQQAGGSYGGSRVIPRTGPDGADGRDGWHGPEAPDGSGRRSDDWPDQPPARVRPGPEFDGPAYGRPPRRRRVPRWAKWTAVIAAGLIFRRAIASIALVALTAALHVVGVNVHLPSIKFGWPWQASTSVIATKTTNTDLGPWVLQKIEGISKPALGRVTFNFLFTHKVSKNIGPWPCWYASTFYAVGYASATVDLNPGPTWWAPGTGHYALRVLTRPAAGKPGSVSVTMVLPQPQLPQTVHDVSIDNLPSKPVATQHSWTYPGFGCGVLLRPQFAESVLYSQAQQLAFYKATHAPQVTRPLISAAETEAAQTIRENFIQPTVNAFGYTLDSFAITWAKG